MPGHLRVAAAMRTAYCTTASSSVTCAVPRCMATMSPPASTCLTCDRSKSAAVRPWLTAPTLRASSACAGHSITPLPSTRPDPQRVAQGQRLPVHVHPRPPPHPTTPTPPPPPPHPPP